MLEVIIMNIMINDPDERLLTGDSFLYLQDNQSATHIIEQRLTKTLFK